MNKRQCDKCGKYLSSYKSLWRHKKTCQNSSFQDIDQNHSLWRHKEKGSPSGTDNVVHHFIGEKRKGCEVEGRPRSKNPKIQALADAIINDDSSEEVLRPDRAAIHTPMSNTDLPGGVDMKHDQPPQHVNTLSRLPLATPEMVADVFRSNIVGDSESDDDDEKLAPLQVTADELTDIFHDIYKDEEKLCPPPADVVNDQRTKAEIVGYDEEESSDDDDTVVESIASSLGRSSSGVVFLPETVDGLTDRLNTLYPKFKFEGKHVQRNELVSLLDELLRQEGITRDEYTLLNNDIAKSLDTPTLRSAVNGILEPAIEELHQILCEFQQQGIAENEIHELDRLLGDGSEFDTDGNPLLPQIVSIVDALEIAADSKIPKSTMHRLRMLVEKLEASKHRIRSTISRLSNARDKEDEGNILKQLATEGLLSVQQYEQLRTVGKLTPEIIAIALGDSSGN